jgi:glycerophosphoryl diester phosphodiesterase
MRLFFSTLLLLNLVGCTKNSNKQIFIFGHAGMGLSMQNAIYHDNSKEAVELCLSFPGSNGVEVDIQMDQQGCLWLYHDDFLDQITSLGGCINSKNTPEIEQCHYKTLKKENLVKLIEILPLIKSNQKIFLDLKISNSCSNSLVDYQLFKHSLTLALNSTSENVCLITNNVFLLSELADQYTTYFSSDNLELSKQIISENPDCRGLVIRNKTIEKSQVSYLKSLGKEIYLFDIRSPRGNRDALKKNPNGIITDDIRAALIERD